MLIQSSMIRHKSMALMPTTFQYLKGWDVYKDGRTHQYTVSGYWHTFYNHVHRAAFGAVSIYVKEDDLPAAVQDLTYRQALDLLQADKGQPRAWHSQEAGTKLGNLKPYRNGRLYETLHGRKKPRPLVYEADCSEEILWHMISDPEVLPGGCDGWYTPKP